jgi:uncharacterized protein (DUF1800 family)
MRSTRALRSALFLLASGCATSPVGAPASASARPHPPLTIVTPTEPREQTADQQVHQVLNRLGFGARPGDAARVREMGVDQWIALQLAPERIDDRAADAVLASYEGLRRPTSELVSLYVETQRALRELQRQAARRGDSSDRAGARPEVLREDPWRRERLRQSQRVVGDVQSAKLARAIVSERQLQEVMTDFWSNHFSVFAGKGPTRLLIPAYERDVIRPNALGKFRALLGLVATSPAMLFYLDQWQSAADSMHPTLAGTRRPRQHGRGLNENYARELLELHTLGVDAGYTQQDVIETARALTGWTMNLQQGEAFAFRPEIHDAGRKTVLGHMLAAGRGIEDGEEVLDILARDPHTARFIARKLAVRFVSDEPPAALVERASDTFLRTDGDIREVVRTIVTSPEFFSRAAYRSKVKSPLELVASALRAVGADADTSMRSAQMVAFLGQPIYGHQAPNGWPETGDGWLNAGTILNRINFGLALAAGRLPNASVARWSEAERLRDAPRETQVDAVVAAFLGGHASPDTRQILLDGENPLVATLTGAAGNRASMLDPPTTRAVAPARGGPPAPATRRELGPPVQLAGLAQVVGLAIGAPEFQRR